MVLERYGVRLLTFILTVDVSVIILSHYSKHGSFLQVELTTAEVESLRSEIAYAEEREAHLKAQYGLPDFLFHGSII